MKEKLARKLRLSRWRLAEWASVTLDFQVRRDVRNLLEKPAAPVVLWYESCGLGDVLMLEPIARAISADVILVCPRPAVAAARRLESIAATISVEEGRKLIDANRHQVLFPSYKIVYENRRAEKHLIDYLGESIGIQNISHQISYQLTEADRRIVQTLPEKYIALHIDALSFREKKEWPMTSWQELVNRQTLPVVLLGGWPRHLFQNCIDLRMKTTIHEAAAVIEGSTLFVGIISGLFWFTNAFQKKAVIINGAFEPPVMTQHPLSSHLTSENFPEFCLETKGTCCQGACMRSISVEAVNEAIQKSLSSIRPL